MKTQFAFIFTVTAFAFSLQTVAAEKILIVSDIDDTIKVSHVLSQAGKVSRAADVTTPFLGMSELYQLLVRRNPEAEIVYLSNAPETIAGVPALKISHQTFLSFNHFPSGPLLLREGLFSENHKLNSLRQMIENEMPTQVVFIGDNGEKDSEIYAQISSEYAFMKTSFLTLIHQVYSSESRFLIPDFLENTGKKLLPEQIGFVTPIEMALVLEENKLLNSADVAWMVQKIGPQIARESRLKWDGLRPISFPLFKDCADFHWNFVRTEALRPVIEKIEKECN